MSYELIKQRLSVSATFGRLTNDAWVKTVSPSKVARVASRLCPSIDRDRMEVMMQYETPPLLFAKANYDNLFSFGQYFLELVAGASTSCMVEPDYTARGRTSSAEIGSIDKIVLAMLVEHDLTFMKSCL